jgi:hypothetical protein
MTNHRIVQGEAPGKGLALITRLGMALEFVITFAEQL